MLLALLLVVVAMLKVYSTVLSEAYVVASAKACPA